MLVIINANQKGGSGKTTTAANLAGALVEAGARVLAVDMDPQSQLATALGAQGSLEFDEDGGMLSHSVADLLIGGKTAPKLDEVIVHTPFEGLDLLPASERLDDARRALEANPAQGLSALRRILSESNFAAHGVEYDYVIIDTAPKLDILLDNALIAGDYVVAVLAPELQQAEPLVRFIGRVQGVQESMRPDLKLIGVLFNKANYDWVATNSIPAMLREMDMPVMDTIIPMYAKLASSYGTGPVTLTVPNSQAAGVMRTAVEELLRRIAEDTEEVSA